MRIRCNDGKYRLIPVRKIRSDTALRSVNKYDRRQKKKLFHILKRTRILFGDTSLRFRSARKRSLIRSARKRRHKLLRKGIMYNTVRTIFSPIIDNEERLVRHNLRSRDDIYKTFPNRSSASVYKLQFEHYLNKKNQTYLNKNVLDSILGKIMLDYRSNDKTAPNISNLNKNKRKRKVNV